MRNLISFNKDGYDLIQVGMRQALSIHELYQPLKPCAFVGKEPLPSFQLRISWNGIMLSSEKGLEEHLLWQH